jgi:hypothetical protein
MTCRTYRDTIHDTFRILFFELKTGMHGIYTSNEHVRIVTSKRSGPVSPHPYCIHSTYRQRRDQELKLVPTRRRNSPPIDAIPNARLGQSSAGRKTLYYSDLFHNRYSYGWSPYMTQPVVDGGWGQPVSIHWHTIASVKQMLLSIPGESDRLDD